jgi:hypothetical protein
MAPRISLRFGVPAFARSTQPGNRTSAPADACVTGSSGGHQVAIRAKLSSTDDHASRDATVWGRTFLHADVGLSRQRRQMGSELSARPAAEERTRQAVIWRPSSWHDRLTDTSGTTLLTRGDHFCPRRAGRP